MYTRQEYAAICSHCQHRKFDRELGVICGITDAPADFEEECLSFKRDERVKLKSIDALEKAIEEDKQTNRTKLIIGSSLSIASIILGFGGGPPFFSLFSLVSGVYFLVTALSEVPQKKEDLD